MNTRSTIILGLCLVLAGGLLGWSLGNGALSVKALDRTVVVKGLAELEVPADVVIWPVVFTAADNDLNALYATLEKNSKQIENFLTAAGIPAAEITRNAPAIVDKLAQQYGNNEARFRYSATQIVTVGQGQIGERGHHRDGEEGQTEADELDERRERVDDQHAIGDVAPLGEQGDRHAGEDDADRGDAMLGIGRVRPKRLRCQHHQDRDGHHGLGGGEIQ